MKILFLIFIVIIGTKGSCSVDIDYSTIPSETSELSFFTAIMNNESREEVILVRQNYRSKTLSLKGVWFISCKLMVDVNNEFFFLYEQVDIEEISICEIEEEDREAIIFSNYHDIFTLNNDRIIKLASQYLGHAMQISELRKADPLVRDFYHEGHACLMALQENPGQDFFSFDIVMLVKTFKLLPIGQMKMENSIRRTKKIFDDFTLTQQPLLETNHYFNCLHDPCFIDPENLRVFYLRIETLNDSANESSGQIYYVLQSFFFPSGTALEIDSFSERMFSDAMVEVTSGKGNSTFLEDEKYQQIIAKFFSAIETYFKNQKTGLNKLKSVFDNGTAKPNSKLEKNPQPVLIDTIILSPPIIDYDFEEKQENIQLKDNVNLLATDNIVNRMSKIPNETERKVLESALKLNPVEDVGIEKKSQKLSEISTTSLVDNAKSKSKTARGLDSEMNWLNDFAPGSDFQVKSAPQRRRNGITLAQNHRKKKEPKSRFFSYLLGGCSAILLTIVISVIYFYLA